jgi:hypothetical protein
MEERVFMQVTDVKNVTSTEMTIEIQNVSPYNIMPQIRVAFIVPMQNVISENWWEWSVIHSEFWNFDDFPLDGNLIAAGEIVRMHIDLERYFGEMREGEYIININLSGRAGPPHPHGWVFNEEFIEISI